MRKRLLVAFGLCRALQAATPTAYLVLLQWLLARLRSPRSRGPSHALLRALRAWAAAEALWHLAARQLARHFEARPVPGAVTRQHRRATFERAMAQVSDVREFVSTWFGGAPLTRISRAAAERWLAYGLWHQPAEALAGDAARDLQQFVTAVEARVGRRFAAEAELEGGISAEPFRPGLEPLRYVHHPLAYYGVMHFLRGAVAPFKMRRLGLRRHETTAGLAYWHRPGEGRAIVFVHGVGVGLGPYAPFLAKLAQLGRPLFAVEVPHVTLGVSLHVPTTADVLRGVRRMLQTHGVASAHWVTHSFGSFYVAWLLRSMPDAVAQATFVDPACFLLHNPKLLHTFLYAEPDDLPGRVFTYLVRRDLFLANALGRQFLWYNNVLWREELSCPALVVLSGEDEVMPVADVALYLGDHVREHVEQLHLPGLMHGEFLVDDAAQDRIVAGMQKLERALTQTPNARRRRVSKAKHQQRMLHKRQHSMPGMMV